ncbi:FxSxx-COOH system tetratricopeptide repeat protein [Streptomyces sp. V4-01]|uniref:FxSxx-COOH system tetratricopeptide repeat protein n=1 Tax=Actinacidiphila polyblastidii TaxID=3110430 RepID=A0ABU7PM67_9ACTN|nr:FxSxx-COOH system tetratricopeptide repeat protein [Streptomyces sp. V4-01]
MLDELKHLHALVGSPSLETLARHAQAEGSATSRSTFGNLLNGRSTRLETVEAFVRACARHARTRRPSITLDPQEVHLDTWRDRYADSHRSGGTRPTSAAPRWVELIADAPRRPQPWPHQVGVLPLLADCRQERPADRDLDAFMATGSGTAVVWQVLSGMGGVGKTQLAAALAHRTWRAGQIDLLIWVAAASRDAVVIAYAQAAADITGLQDDDPEQGASRFLAWLSEPHRRRWLIVLDDLQNPADLNGLWPPSVPCGRAIVTTRRRDAALSSGRYLVEVGLFTPKQSTAYLSARLGGDGDLLADDERLAEDLGHLPLALAQAGAYIVDRGLSCAEYRHRLNDARRRLADLTPEPGALPDEQRATVAATWSLSIDLADSLTPRGLSRPVLELAALLDPNAIPAELLTTSVVTAYLSGRRDHEEPVEADDVRDVLHCLHRLSLLTLDPVDPTIRVHALVQRAVRESAHPEHADALAMTVADALLSIWPDIENDPSHGQALRANTAALRAAAGTALWNTETGAHRVLFAAGISLGEAGLVSAAAAYYGDLGSTAVQRLGAEHPHTLAVRAGHARWRGEAGDTFGAFVATEALLADRLRVLGPDHLDTLTTRHNLAYWQGESGDPAGAATAFDNLLHDMARLLGPDHPDTLTTRNDLAWWRGKAGDPAGAAEALRALLGDRQRVLGPDHLHSMITRNDLAWWRGLAGDPSGAVNAFSVLLPDLVRVLGPDHPRTLTTRNNLAWWQGAAGDPLRALAALGDVYADRLRVLGPDHPHTMITRGSLAYWTAMAGDPDGAVRAFEALLTDRLRVLGPEHPHTRTNRQQIIYWSNDPGCQPTTGALMTDMVQVLGPDHPDTLTVWSHDSSQASPP